MIRSGGATIREDTNPLKLAQYEFVLACRYHYKLKDVGNCAHAPMEGNVA